MICPRCKENVLDGSSFCVKCGYNFNMNNNQNNMVGNNQQPNNQMVNNNQMNSNVNNYSNNFNNNLNGNINYGNNDSNNNDIFKEKKKGNKAVIAVIAILIVGIVGFFGYKLFTGKTGGIGTKEDDEVSFEIKADFIQNNDLKYAIFDYKGKQVTDFIYNYVWMWQFTYGTAVVKNDEGYFIVDQSGKELTKPGEYSDIEINGILYDATYETDGNSSSGNYLSLKGKKLFSKSEYEIVPPLYSSLTFSLIRNKKTKDVSFIDHNGKTVVTIPYKDGEELKYVFSDDKRFLTLFYNNKSYIFNLNTNELLQTIDFKSLYAFDGYDEGDKILITYNVNFKENKDDKIYKVFKNGKLIETEELETKCATTHLHRFHVTFKQGMVVCEYDLGDEMYMFDKSFKYLGDTKDYLYILDKDNYIKDHKIYKDGKEVKSIPCLVRGRSDKFNDEDMYFLAPSYSARTCDGIKEGFGALYDKSGNKINNNNFSYLGKFDSNGLAEASDDSKTVSLINKKGEKVITGYMEYKYFDGYYMVKKNNQVGLIDKDGKEIFPCEYSTVDIRSSFGTKIVSLMKYGSTKMSIAYDLKNNKEIFNDAGVVSFGNTYYSIYDEKKNTDYYYSYSTGEMFFTRSYNY